ncbi:MAG: hypothetical protein Q9166_007878 [cf. Caloplaca sp. 2 TL-2023]
MAQWSEGEASVPTESWGSSAEEASCDSPPEKTSLSSPVVETSWDDSSDVRNHQPEAQNAGDYDAFIPKCFRGNQQQYPGDESDYEPDNEFDDEPSFDNVPDKSKSPILASISEFAADLKSSLKRKASRLWKNQDNDKVDGYSAKRNSWKDDWDDQLLGDNQPVQQVGEKTVERKLPSFTDPLPKLSTSSQNGEQDFLSRFLSERRLVDIHPARKHDLANFLARICEEASFEHLMVHDPTRLSLLRLETPDQLELQPWIDLIGRVRYPSGSADDGSRWPWADVWCEREIRESDNVAKLRQVAVHRWDYDTKLIEDVVDYLAKLKDEERRRQVQDAVRELYEDECAAKARMEAGTLEARDHIEVPECVLDYILKGVSATVQDEIVSQDSHIPLVGKASDKEIAVTDEDESIIHVAEAELSNQHDSNDTTPLDTSTAVFHKGSKPTPLIKKPQTVSTYHQFLSSYQDTLETCLFNFDRRTNPNCTDLCPHELDFYQNTNFTYRLSKAYPDQPLERIEHLLYGARQIRNSAAHHNEFPPESLVNGQFTGRFFRDAQAIATLVKDDDAAREIRLATWVADINFSAAANRMRARMEARSVGDWENLLKGAEKWRDDLGESWDEESRPEWNHSWLYGQLSQSIEFFRERRGEARRLLWGEEGEEIVRRWEESSWMSVRYS